MLSTGFDDPCLYFVFVDCRTQLRLESLEDAIVLERCDSDDGVWRKHGYPAYVTPEVLMSRGARYSGRAADLVTALSLSHTHLAHHRVTLSRRPTVKY